MVDIEKAKKELIFILEIDSKNEHCEESIQDIEKCQSIDDLADVLNKHAISLKRKEVPLYYFIKKHLAEDIKTLNKNNIYIDQQANLSNIRTDKCLFVLGNSDVYLYMDKSAILDVQLYDYSGLIIDARGCAIARVVTHKKSRCMFNTKQNARVIIRKYNKV